jgi:hypothetical protein
VQPQNGVLTYGVAVQNFSGHRFPTGAGFRRGFLEFRLLDANDKTLWVSGAVNGFGAMIDNTGRVLSTEFPPGDVKCPAGVLQRRTGPGKPAITRQDQAQIYECAPPASGQLTTATTRLFAAPGQPHSAGRLDPAIQLRGTDRARHRGSQIDAHGERPRRLCALAYLGPRASAATRQHRDRSGRCVRGSGLLHPGGVQNGQPTGIAGVDNVLYRIPERARRRTVAKCG